MTKVMMIMGMICEMVMVVVVMMIRMMKVMSCRTSSLGLGQGELDQDLDKYSHKIEHND